MIHRHLSENGLRTVLEEIPNVRSVTIGIWIQTGSRNESEEINGISHFLEHMFFKGTEKRSAQEIAEFFDSIGGQVNAFTSKEHTCLYAKVLDTHKELALDVLTDMLFNSVFDLEEMKREKKVILEEIKMVEDTPDDIVHDLLAKSFYGDHPMGYPILGTDKQVKSFKRDQLIAYMEKRYTPDNIVVSVAGNVDVSFIDSIEDHFQSLKGKSVDTVSLEVPTYLSRHLSRDKPTEQAHYAIGFPGIPIHNENMYSLILLNNVLGGNMSSRLFQEIREKQGLAYSVYSYHSAHIDHGLLTIYAGTGKEDLPLLEDSIKRIVDDLLENGMTDTELHNNKEQLKGNLVLGLESTSSRMTRNARNELMLQEHRSIDDIIVRLDAVDHLAIEKVMETVFTQKPSTALVAPK